MLHDLTALISAAAAFLGAVSGLFTMLLGLRDRRGRGKQAVRDDQSPTSADLRRPAPSENVKTPPAPGNPTEPWARRRP
jgi:hypothetical protein